MPKKNKEINNEVIQILTSKIKKIKQYMKESDKKNNNSISLIFQKKKLEGKNIILTQNLKNKEENNFHNPQTERLKNKITKNIIKNGINNNDNIISENKIKNIYINNNYIKNNKKNNNRQKKKKISNERTIFGNTSRY